MEDDEETTASDKLIRIKAADMKACKKAVDDCKDLQCTMLKAGLSFCEVFVIIIVRLVYELEMKMREVRCPWRRLVLSPYIWYHKPQLSVDLVMLWRSV